MKEIVLYLFVLLILGFVPRHLMAEVKSEMNDSIVNVLIEQARWGDGQACVELAKCYQEGIGGEQDFLSTALRLIQARDFGAIDDLDSYLAEALEGSNFKLTIDGFFKIDEQPEAALLISEQMIANGLFDGYTIQGLIAMEQGDTLKGIELTERAADQGSSFAEVLLCFPSWRETSEPDIDRLKALADKRPVCYLLLANGYTDSASGNMKNDSLAAYYFIKADQYGFLGRKDAHWLLQYYENGGDVKLTEEDVRRLQKLAGDKKDMN